MKLNKVEKVIVVIIVLGLILGLGIFMLVKPSFENIGKQQKVLDSYRTELNDLNTKLARLDTIDADIDEQKTEARKYETKFYPDLTTYEASEMAMAYLQAANLEAHSISITSMSTKSLSLSYFTPPSVGYELKSYGASAKKTEQGDEEILEAGQFKDGNKVYSVTVNSIAEVVITDENGEVVPVSRYTDNMKKVYKAALCKYVASQDASETTGLITASYEVKGTYKDYIDFIDHIYALERATTVPNVVIPMTYTPEKDKEDDTTYIDEAGFGHSNEEVAESGAELPIEDDTEVTQTITLMFLTVEPMKALNTLDIDGTTVVVDQRPAVY